jgi:hypothetical protein
MTKNKSVKRNFGLVAMLDALGTKNLSIQESKKFIRSIEDLCQEAKADVVSYCLTIQAESLGNKIIDAFGSHFPEIVMIGDTILVHCQFNS